MIQMRCRAGELVQGIEKQLYSFRFRSGTVFSFWADISMMPFKLYMPVNWKGRFARNYIILLYGNLSQYM